MKHQIQDIASLHTSSIPPEDFFLLLSFVSRKSKEYLIAHPEHRLSEIAYHTLVSLIRRRMNHEPIALITGHKEFYGFDFSVDRTTLVPRPETESLVELVLEDLDRIAAWSPLCSGPTAAASAADAWPGSTLKGMPTASRSSRIAAATWDP